MSRSTVESESQQIDVTKDEKKVQVSTKKKKSVRSSEGSKSKSSTGKSSSDIPNSEVIKKPEEIQRDDFVDRKENLRGITGNDAAENKSKNARGEGEDTGEKSEGRNTVLLRETDFRKLAELKEAFHLFDINRDGYIDKEDLRFTFTSMGKPNVTEEALDQMLSDMCASSAVDFDTFVKLFGHKTVELDSEDELLSALSNWDYLGSGMISEERLKRDLQAWGDKFSAKEAEWALEEAPTYKKDGTTMIDYVKFCHDLCAMRNVEKTRQIEKKAEARDEDLRSFVK